MIVQPKSISNIKMYGFSYLLHPFRDLPSNSTHTFSLVGRDYGLEVTVLCSIRRKYDCFMVICEKRTLGTENGDWILIIISILGTRKNVYGSCIEESRKLISLARRSDKIHSYKLFCILKQTLLYSNCEALKPLPFYLWFRDF